MIETIVGGLVVSLIGGLTFLAFKNPKNYLLSSNIVSLFVAFIFLTYVIWCLGYYMGFSDGGSANNLAQPNLPIDPFWLMILAVILEAYFWLLKKIPTIFKLDKEQEE